MSDLEETALRTISEGSKSFSLASKFFPRDQMISASLIYMWCRHCDDVIDENGGTELSLKVLRNKTSRVWNGESNPELPFAALNLARERCNLPSTYAMELLNGMEMDIKGTAYYTLNELKLYCFRVASTVGLLMCHVMGLFRISALEQAAKLGMAMQLTNIARDVKTDFEMGRLYLPQTWLNDVGLTKENYFESANRNKLYQVVLKLIDESEKLYKEGLEGCEHLPFKSALTIQIAGRIYRQIGRDIRSRGSSSLDERVVVSTFSKILQIAFSFLIMVLMIPGRLIKNQKPITIDQTWIYS